MKIESVVWSTYNLSFDDLIEAWIVAADSVAVIAACIRTVSGSETQTAD